MELLEQLTTKIRDWFYPDATVHVGTIESYDFTFGGAGNQLTMIDGVEYATYWDMHTKDWKVGDVVTFRKFKAPLIGRDYSVWQARDIHKLIHGDKYIQYVKYIAENGGKKPKS